MSGMREKGNTLPRKCPTVGRGRLARWARSETWPNRLCRNPHSGATPSGYENPMVGECPAGQGAFLRNYRCGEMAAEKLQTQAPAFMQGHLAAGLVTAITLEVMVTSRPRRSFSPRPATL